MFRSLELAEVIRKSRSGSWSDPAVVYLISAPESGATKTPSWVLHWAFLDESIKLTESKIPAEGWKTSSGKILLSSKMCLKY